MAAQFIHWTGMATGENFPAIFHAHFKIWNIGVLAVKLEIYAYHESFLIFRIKRRAGTLAFYI